MCSGSGSWTTYNRKIGTESRCYELTFQFRLPKHLCVQLATKIFDFLTNAIMFRIAINAVLDSCDLHEIWVEN